MTHRQQSSSNNKSVAVFVVIRVWISYNIERSACTRTNRRSTISDNINVCTLVYSKMYDRMSTKSIISHRIVDTDHKAKDTFYLEKAIDLCTKQADFE